MRWRGASSKSSEAGTQVALRPEPTRANDTRRLGLRERGRLRRRVRFLRKRRELELRDLGGLIFDMYRFGSKRQDLVRDKLQEMFAADGELREFEQLLGRRPRRLDVREAGVGGACPRCRQLYSTEARFCSHCGETLADGAPADVVVAPVSVAEPAAFHSPPEPAPEPQTWQDPEPQAQAWQDTGPHAPATEPQTQAWQASQAQAPAAQRWSFKRRKTPTGGAHAAADGPPETDAWDRYQATVQARRRAQETEYQPAPEQPEPEAGDLPDWRSGDGQR